MSLISINPTNGAVIKEYDEYSDIQINALLEKADKAFNFWKEQDILERSGNFKKLSSLLHQQKEALGRLISLEMGKPISESYAEIEKCAMVCDYYATYSQSILVKEFISSDATDSYVVYQPLGLILAVMPWNYPFWQVFRFAAPALMAGNGAILKHASNVSGCALAIESLFSEAGFPEGLFCTILTSSKGVESLIANKSIQAVTLTGSEGAGSAVASLAGKYLKKSVLELGGSDPFIVLEDADLEMATDYALKSRFLNTGQSCIAAKRFIVLNGIFQDFQENLLYKINKLKLGNPLLEETNIGPMAKLDLLEVVLNQIQKSVDAGASVLYGGNKIGDEGAFLEPTLLTNVFPGMPVFDEEVFGPVLPLTKVNSVDEAIKLANQTKYGLGASIWTRNISLAEKLALKIDSGAVFINGMVKSDPRLPFGGIKNSGYGRELSHFGIKEFVNVKTIWVK